MTDLAFFWDIERYAADLDLAATPIGGVDLATDDGLQTAVLISLFTEARAGDDDELPAGETRGGWWGDSLAEDGRPIGSRLWLLRREKRLAAVVQTAAEYAREALTWLVDDGVAESVDVSAEIVHTQTLGLAITITRPSGERRRFDFAWSAVAAKENA